MAQNNLPTRKKVLFLITKATWGGAQRYVYDLATHLSQEEFEPVVAYGESGRSAKMLSDAGVATHPLPSLGRDVAVVSDILSFFEILSCLRKVRPDVLHLNSSKAAALGALAARMLGVRRIVFTVHGWPFLEKRSFLWRAFAWFGSWVTALLSHVVICISNYDLHVARRMPCTKYKTVRIYNGITLRMSFGSGERVRNAFPPGANITGTVGELTKNKGQGSLIEQAKNNPNMFVAIVGEGEERAQLEEMVARYNLGERVKLFGFIPAGEVLRGFDVFALPSNKEGLPYVLIEARVAAIPIFANRLGR